MDKNLLYKYDPQREPQATTAYMLNLLKMQARAIDLAQQSQQSVMDKYDLQHQIPIGHDYLCIPMSLWNIQKVTLGDPIN